MMKNKKQIFLIVLLGLIFSFDFESINIRHITFRFVHHLLTVKHTFTIDHKRPNLSAAFRAAENVIPNRSMNAVDLTADVSSTIEQKRRDFRVEIVIPYPNGCRSEREIFEYDGHRVETYWLDYRQQPNDDKSNGILLYFHGGGYVLGDFQGFSGFACHLSRYFNLIVNYLEYRLAPEHPLPAAVHDALILYQALLHDGFSASQITILGDSAGGGLALLTVQAILQRHLPKPVAVITLSPWTDLSLSGESYIRNRWTESILCVAEISPLTNLVLGANHSALNRNHSKCSPLFGSFENFPPLYVSVGTTEILEDDGRRVAEKAKNQGVNVTLVAGEHMMHVYPMFFSYFPEAKSAMEEIVHWWTEEVFLYEKKLNIDKQQKSYFDSCENVSA